MKLGEKMSYLMGLIDGMDIDTTTNEGKILKQMSEVMQGVVTYIDDLQSQIDELTELCDILDSDLGDIEEDFYDFDELDESDESGESEYKGECDCGSYSTSGDEELFEVCCPECENTVVLNEVMLNAGAIECSNCGARLEFDFSEFEEGSADE